MPHSNTNLARRVVCNAHDYNRVPSVISDSWAQLKQAHGHPITADRMERLERLRLYELPARTGATPTPTPPLAQDLADRAPRVAQRIADYLKAKRSA